MTEEFFLPEKAKDKIAEEKVKTIMIIGASDTGKTFLVEKLANFCSLVLKKETAILDLDVGQSHIGPPTTVAWAKVEGKFESWDKLKVRDFYFVGDVSPRGNLLPLIIGAKLMQDEAKKVAEKIIVDTTGLVRGGIGKVLKLQLIDVLKPEVIFALYKEDELEHILSPLEGLKIPEVFKIPVPAKVKVKDFLQRRYFRHLKFKKYFSEAREIEFLQKEVGINGLYSVQDLSFLLVSLRDKANKDMALGIIKNFNKVEGKITIFSPVSSPEKVGRVVPGKIRLILEQMDSLKRIA